MPRTTTKHSSWLGTGLVVLLAACATGRPHSARAGEAAAPHLRTSTSLAGERSADDRHSRPLPDPRTSGPVSLAALFAFADANAPTLAVARSTRARADAVKVAASPLLPANPSLGVGVGPRYGISGIGVDAEVSLSQRLYIAGERRRRVAAAGRFAELTDADIEQIRWSVHCDIHAGFHRALVMREQARLAQRVLSFQEELLRVVEGQVKAGEASPLMLRLAHAELAQSRQGLIAADQAFYSARIQLAQLSGWPVAHPPDPKGELDPPRDPPPLDQLMAAAREQLPALRVRAAAVREAEARVSVARRETWPQPTIGVQYRHEGNPTSEGPYDIVMGTLGVSLPSFQRNQGERARARADLTVAEAERSAAQALLEGQIAQARSEAFAAAERVRSYGAEVLPRFEENLKLLRRAFEIGEIDLLSLSIGRERFLRIQSDALGTRLDYFVALANLERAVGVDLWRDHHDEGTTP